MNKLEKERLVITYRDKFIKNNIPFDEIDKDMIELIDLLNFKLKLKTKFCCFGHGKNCYGNENISVIFDECVTDNQIYPLAEFLFSKKMELFRLSKVVKPVWNELLTNWELEIYNLFTRKDRLTYMKKLLSVLKELNPIEP